MEEIPLTAQLLLPPVTLTVQDFLAYELPSIAPNTCFIRPDKYLSTIKLNVDNIDEIAALVTPPGEVLDSLHAMDRLRAKSIICPHETSAGGKRYPMWVLTYWLRVKDLRGIQHQWRSAMSNLQRIKTWTPPSQLLQTVDSVMSHLPWAGEIPGFSNRVDMHLLSFYLTMQWLTDDHESIMLELLRREVEEFQEDLHIKFEGPFFTVLLCTTYNNCSEYGTDRSYQWLRDLGTDLGSHHRSELVTIFNVNESHWGAIIADFNQKLIRYGDSMEGLLKAEVKAALNWWLYFHMGQTFTYTKLPTTCQRDPHSCGILAWNALAHYFFPKRYPLLDASHMQDAWLHMLLKILGFSEPEFNNVSNYLTFIEISWLSGHTIGQPSTMDRSPEPSLLS